MSVHIHPMREKWITALLAMSALLFVAVVLLAPEASFQASLQGLKIWWDYVFPVLLPYFILVETLMAAGMFRRSGKWLDKICHACLRIPGIGGIIILSGLTAGYPAGAKFTASALEHRQLSLDQAQKTLILSHMCHPVLTINLVAVVFLQDPAAGPFLFAVQWLSMMFVAVFLRAADSSAKQDSGDAIKASISQSFTTAKNIASFGQILSMAVKNSVQQLLMIGGIMIFFSVAIHLTAQQPILHAVTAALTEIHLGAYMISDIDFMYLLKIGLVSAMLVFGGFSVHTQVKALIAGSGLRYGSFLMWKLVQTVAAFCFAVMLWRPYYIWIDRTAPIFWPRELSEHVPIAVSGWSVYHLTLLLCSCLAFIVFTWLPKVLSKR